MINDTSAAQSEPVILSLNWSNTRYMEKNVNAEDHKQFYVDFWKSGPSELCNSGVNDN